MNIFQRGLNFIVDIFKGKEEDEKDEKELEPSPIAQTTPTGIIEKKEEKEPVLEFNIPDDILTRELEKAKRDEAKKTSLQKTSEFAKDITAAPGRAILGGIKEITDSDIPYTPGNDFTRVIFGEDPTGTTEQQGREMLSQMTDASPESIDTPTALVGGISMGILDTVFGGKTKAASKIAKSKIIDDIFPWIKKALPKIDDTTALTLSEELTKIDDPKLVLNKMKDTAEKIAQFEQKFGEPVIHLPQKGMYANLSDVPLEKRQQLMNEVSNVRFTDNDIVHISQKSSIGKSDEMQEVLIDDLIKESENVKSSLKQIDYIKDDKYAFNINMQRYGLDQGRIASLSSKIDSIKPELEKVKGSKMTNNEVIDAARSSDLMTKATSREDVLEANATFLKTRNRITEIEKALSNPKVSSEQKRTLIGEQIKLLEVVSEEAASRGRALQSLRITTEDSGQLRTKLLKDLSKITDDTDKLIKQASEVNFDNAQEVADFYRSFVKPKTSEIIEEFRYNNMLSNPRTQLRNLFSNMMQSTVYRPATKFVSAGIDLLQSSFTGKEREYLLKEVPIYYKNFIGALPEAFRSFSDAYKGTALVGKPDLARIPTGSLPKFFRLPTRLMEAGDVFFRTLIRAGEQASLQARGMKGAEAFKEAQKVAEYSLFRAGLDPKNKTGQGALLSSIDKTIGAIDNLRDKMPFGRWFIPFLRTPMNFAKQWIEYSPAGLGTLYKNTRKKEQIAKMMIGSGVTAIGAMKAMQEETTWSVPTDPEAKSLFYASGKKPYSVKIGENWVPMMYLGPGALALALPAAIKHYYGDNPDSLTDSQLEKIAKAVASTGEFLSQQTFMEGLGQFIDLFRGDPDKSLEKSLAFTSGQVIPWQGMVRYVSTVVDPVYRKTDSFVEEIEKNLPFLSKGIEPYRDPTGELSTRNMSSYLAPYDISNEKEEFDNLLKYRTEVLKMNRVFNEIDQEKKKQAKQIITNMEQARSKEDFEKAIAPIKDDKEVRKAFTALIKKQAHFMEATIEPLKYLEPKERAEVLIGRWVMMDSQKDFNEFSDLMKAMSEKGLMDSKTTRHFGQLIQDLNSNKEEEEEEEEEEDNFFETLFNNSLNP